MAIGALEVHSAALWAHHSVFADFDINKRISVTGTLTKVDWINPHVMIEVDVPGADGKLQRWTFESNPPSWYRSLGISRDVFQRAIGQTVTAEGARAKNDFHSAHIQRMKLPDGTALNLFTAPGIRPLDKLQRAPRRRSPFETNFC